MPPDDVLDNGGFAGSRQTRDKDMITRPRHLQAESDGLHGAALADDVIKRLDFFGALKAELGGIASAF